MWLLGVALSGVLFALALAVARRRPRHGAVAVLVAGGALADIARRALGLYVLGPMREARPGLPFLGWPRAAFHLDELLLLAWPAGLAALSAFVFLRERPRRRAMWGIAAAYVAAAAAAVALYPDARGELLRRAVFVAELGALAMAAGSIVAWWLRPDAAALTEGTVFVLVAIEAGAVLGWFLPNWDFQSGLYLVAYGALVFLHLGELWAGSRASTSV